MALEGRRMTDLFYFVGLAIGLFIGWDVRGEMGE